MRDFFLVFAALILLLTIAGPGMAEQTVAELEIRPLPPEKMAVSLNESQLKERKGLLLGYSVAIVLASILGGYLPEKIRLTHTRIQLMLSFVGGLMLGVAIFHLLLHALLDSPRSEISGVLTALALGILIMFLLLRAFHFHQHDVSLNPGPHEETERPSLRFPDQTTGHTRHSKCDHDHPQSGMESIVSESAGPVKRRFSWLGIALGLGLHSMMDGVALSASLLRPATIAETAPLWGLATFFAILLHKPLDAVSITSVMSASGWSRSKCTLVNISFAMMCPLGAMLAWWGIMGTHSHAVIISQLLAFSAGVFLCIALSDLLPEMQFHAHNQGQLTACLLAGLGLAWLLMAFNPMHQLS